ncbi:MAG: hypothetical protein WCH39_01865 [Schlesneria sp.]|jgi:hypothetical protein
MAKKKGLETERHHIFGTVTGVSHTVTPTGTGYAVIVRVSLNPAAGESVYTVLPFPFATGINSAGNEIAPPIPLTLLSGNIYTGSGNLTERPVHVRVTAKFLSAAIQVSD